MITISEEIKAKIVIEADTSGADEAAAALEKLQGMAGSFSGEGGIGDAISTMSDNFAEGARGAEDFADAIGTGEEAVKSGEEAVSSFNDALEEHQQATEDAATAQEAFSGQVEETAKQLKEVPTSLNEVTKSTQAMSDQVAKSGDTLSSLSDNMANFVYANEGVSSWWSDAMLAATEKTYNVLQPATPTDFVPETLWSAGEQAKTISDAFSGMTVSAEEAGKAVNDFFGSNSEQYFSDVGSSATDAGQAVNDFMDTYQPETLWSVGEQAKSASSNISGFAASTQDANQAAKDFLDTNSAQYFADIGTSAKSADEVVSDFLGTTKKSGGFFSGIFGEGGALGDIGGAFGDIGGMFGGMSEAFGGFMMSFDTFMRPLMMLQMGGQMVGALGSWLYNTNLAMEGPGASNPYSFTSQVNQLGLSAQQGADQFGLGFGQGLNPSLNAWNYANNQNQNGTDFWGGVGRFSGGATGILWSLGELALGSILGGSSGTALNLSGAEGLQNAWAAMTGKPLPFPGTPNPNNIYNGQDSMAAWLQSSYGGSVSMYPDNGPSTTTSWTSTGPTDPMSAYEHAIAMRTGGVLNYPLPTTAPTPDIGADWSYFQGMPTGAPGPSYQGSGGYGGTIQNPAPPGGLSNLFDPTAWQGAFNDVFGSNGAITQTLYKAAGGINSLFGGPSAPDQYEKNAIGDFGNIFSSLGSGNFGGAWGSLTRLLTPGAEAGSYGAQGFSGNFGGGCFVAGTRVLLADGSERAIEQLRKGDQVVGYDGKKAIPVTIQACITFPRKQTYQLMFSDGNTLTLTDSHPLYSPDAGWRSLSPAMTKEESPELPVSQLEIGDVIATVDGTCMLLAIEKKQIEQVYNITVNGTHTYYANGVLVHNIKAGAGTETVSGGGGIQNLEHTFVAKVNWEEQNLVHQATAAAHWAEQGLIHMATAVAHWAEQGVQHAVTAVANWTEQNVIHPVVAAAEWAEQNLVHMATAVAQWADQNLIHPVVAMAQWAEQNLVHMATATAQWAEKNLEHLFTGVASWVGQNLFHTFVGIASWVSQGANAILSAFAEGVSDYSGGPAVVGEAGMEVVEHNGQYALVDQPTFLNLPAGSSVYPMQNLSMSSPRMFADGTGGSISPIFLGAVGGGAQTANIIVNLDSQTLISLMGASLMSSVNVGLGKRNY